ncbi:HEAT repeat domain-containing protein [Nocardia sp. NPDC050408]|uniref:HEAT repeat domain-containing protein n=1 Tax=Nocardia sp. NPDC050408 TaxID=3364319 RepID=UPI00379121CA
MAVQATKLLRDIEPLTAAERQHAIAAGALRLAGRPELWQLLAELAGRGYYERIIAIRMAAVVADVAVVADHEHLLAELDSGGPEFGTRAVVGLVRTGVDPEVLIERLPRMSQRIRRTMYRALGYGQRSQLADPLLPQVRRWFGDAEAARVLPNCSPPVVAKYLPELDYAVENWAALGRRHIDAVLDHVEGLAAEAGESDWPNLWRWIAAGSVPAAQRHPDRLLALATRAVRYTSIYELSSAAGQLARHDPARVAELILDPTANGTGLSGTALWRALGGLPDDRLVALGTVYSGYQRDRFLRALPLARRTIVVRQVFARTGVDPDQVPMTALDALPHQERTALARELLDRPGGADVRAVRERLIARLPWNEAEPILAEAIRRSTADERAQAYPLFIMAAAGTRDPAVVATMLESLRRLRNEQDPVRYTALQAVNNLPPSLLRAEHLTVLEQLGTEALQARDCSYPTRTTISGLARTLLRRGVEIDDPSFTDTALRLIESLATHAVFPDLNDLDRSLPHGTEQRIFAALRRRIDNDAARDQWRLTLDLADGLNKRSWKIPALQQLLIRACGARDDQVVRRAVRLALSNPSTRDQTLTTLLNRDRSLITLDIVQRLIATRRTDLLDSLLGSATPGRFASPKVRLVPDFYSGFDRWTPPQVESYARLLTSHFESKKSSQYEKVRAVRILGRLPGSADRLAEYTEHPDIPIAEAALTALGRSDQTEAAIELLARHVDTDRARAAVSSIATCAKSLGPDKVANAVAPLVDSPKITSRKEGVRLLAELHAPDAMDALQALWAQPDQHRDVRRAVVFACRWLLDTDAAWQIFADAAADPTVADEILNLRPELLPIAQRHRMAELIRQIASGTDSQLAARAIPVLHRWSRWSPPDTAIMLAHRICDLDELGLWLPATQALVDNIATTADDSALTAAVDRLLAGGDHVIPGRDLPAVQRLVGLTAALGTAAERSDAARSAASALADRLSTEPFWRESAINLYLAQIRWAESKPTARLIQQAGAVATGALVDYPARRVEATLPSVLRTARPETMHAIAGTLSRSDELAGLLAAVTLIQQCGNHFGWSTPWVDLLAALRAHDTIDIRVAAAAVWMVAE